MLKLTLHRDPEKYARSVRAFLEQHEDENALLLGCLERFIRSPKGLAPFMAQLTEGAETVAAAYYEERNLLITRGPDEAWREIAQALHQERIEIPGVVGPSSQAKQMALAWTRLQGGTSHLAMDQMLYRLRQVLRPEGVEGEMHLAVLSDLDLLSEWLYLFRREALPYESCDRDEMVSFAATKIKEAMTYLWKVKGNPVATAALSRPTRCGISVNAVFTPPKFRRKGYAAALVADVSQAGLDQGKEFCVVYADLMNPTSNSIYRKIGYLPAGGSRNYRFALN
jgi:predicted GNAT family acetyltransferase